MVACGFFLLAMIWHNCSLKLWECLWKVMEEFMCLTQPILCCYNKIFKTAYISKTKGLPRSQFWRYNTTIPVCVQLVWGPFDRGHPGVETSTKEITWQVRGQEVEKGHSHWHRNQPSPRSAALILHCDLTTSNGRLFLPLLLKCEQMSIHLRFLLSSF